MSVAAAFAVVLIHVSAGAVVKTDSSTWFASQVFGCLGRWAVPVFVMISGALLLSNPKHEPILQFYSKRSIWSILWSFMLSTAFPSVRQDGPGCPFRC